MIGFSARYATRSGKVLGWALIVAGICCGSPRASHAISAFEEMIQQRGGEIPFPFDEFTAPATADFVKKTVADCLKTPGATAQSCPAPAGNALPSFDGGIFPYGRSLVKDKANAFNPRAMVVIPGFSDSSVNPKPLTIQDRMFIGYAPNANALEVISWNRTLRRWDFQIVENYEKGKKPVVKSDMKRESCTGCHQGGAPIFPVKPWREGLGSGHQSATGMEGNDKLTARVKTMRLFSGKGTNYFGYRIGAKDESFSSGVLFGLDVATRSANDALQLSTACGSVCGNDVECQDYLLERVLTGGLPALDFKTVQDKKSKKDKSDKEFQRFLKFEAVVAKNWPKDGFAFSSSIIPDRDPLENEAQGGTSTFADDMYKSPGDVQENAPGFTKIVGIKGPADPSTTRPKVQDIRVEDAAVLLAEGKPECLGLRGTDFQGLARFGPDRVRAALAKLRSDPKKYNALIQPWPPNVDGVLAGIFNKLGDTQAGECYQRAADNVPKEPEGVEDADLAATNVLDEGKTTGKFLKYCKSCHLDAKGFEQAYGHAPSDKYTKETIGPAFMLGDLDWLKTRPEAKPAPEKIRNCEMPPPPDDKPAKPGIDSPTFAERREMLKLLGDPNWETFKKCPDAK